MRKCVKRKYLILENLSNKLMYRILVSVSFRPEKKEKAKRGIEFEFESTFRYL